MLGDAARLGDGARNGLGAGARPWKVGSGAGDGAGCGLLTGAGAGCTTCMSWLSNTVLAGGMAGTFPCSDAKPELAAGTRQVALADQRHPI
mmetsp:Transcript_41201/g.74483  ORF Transcript_41201/g.74483 Transcript_41201/m.74483 type:complete len:91 (-) Transcript_41201:1376-1648(-)